MSFIGGLTVIIVVGDMCRFLRSTHSQRVISRASLHYGDNYRYMYMAAETGMCFFD